MLGIVSVVNEDGQAEQEPWVITLSFLLTW